MAKKRRERRETDGLSSTQEEVKASDSQALKGGYRLCEAEEREPGRLGDTDRLSNITSWQRKVCSEVSPDGTAAANVSLHVRVL